MIIFLCIEKIKMEERLKAAVIGAGRNRNGIGEFIVKFLTELDVDVNCILGSTKESSEKTSEHLNKKFGIESRPYHDINKMLENEELDFVVIASPSKTHMLFLKKCIERKLPVFCEKPFIWNDDKVDCDGFLKMTKALVDKSRKYSILLAMNCQWPHSIRSYEKLCGKIKKDEIKTFYALMNPSIIGKEMIADTIPHVISILVSVLGKGEMSRLTIERSPENDEAMISYDYNGCKVVIELVSKKEQPRDLKFGFNDKIINRKIDISDYRIYFEYEDDKLLIEDPLKSSIKDFLESLENEKKPLIGSDEILENMEQLCTIYDSFVKSRK